MVSPVTKYGGFRPKFFNSSQKEAIKSTKPPLPIFLYRHGHTTTPNGEKQTFGGAEILSEKGIKSSVKAGKSFARQMVDQHRDISQYQIILIHSEAPRTKLTAESWLEGLTLVMSKNGLPPVPTPEYREAQELNSPDWGDFIGLEKYELYLQYAGMLNQEDQVKYKAIETLFKDKGLSGDALNREIGRRYFRQSWLRSFMPEIPGWENRRLGENMQNVADRHLKLIKDLFNEQISTSLIVCFGHSHGILALNAAIRALSTKQWKKDPNIPKVSLGCYQINSDGLGAVNGVVKLKKPCVTNQL
jgi:broad specificity phosphatase PhoE